MSELDQLQCLVGEWAEVTFPFATDRTIMAHLTEEVDELGEAIANEHMPPLSEDGSFPSIREEAADCLMLLLHLAHRNRFSLIAEVGKKFVINKQRTWNTVTAEGYTKHDATEGDAS